MRPMDIVKPAGVSSRKLKDTAGTVKVVVEPSVSTTLTLRSVLLRMMGTFSG